MELSRDGTGQSASKRGIFGLSVKHVHGGFQGSCFAAVNDFGHLFALSSVVGVLTSIDEVGTLTFRVRIRVQQDKLKQ
jgi:hypothetical protein